MKKSKKILCPTDKDYKMFIFYDTYLFGKNLQSTFELMSFAIANGSWQFVDLEEMQRAMKQDFKYLIARKRYEGLKVWSNNALTYDKNGFHLEGHVFETLDEVRKALDNKAFL